MKTRNHRHPHRGQHDVHGSVSQLLSDAGAVKASYGYDAYGGQDAPTSDRPALTTGDVDNQAPLNPYRYTSKRLDSGTATSLSAVAGIADGLAARARLMIGYLHEQVDGAGR